MSSEGATGLSDDDGSGDAFPGFEAASAAALAGEFDAARKRQRLRAP